MTTRRPEYVTGGVIVAPKTNYRFPFGKVANVEVWRLPRRYLHELKTDAVGMSIGAPKLARGFSKPAV